MIIRSFFVTLILFAFPLETKASEDTDEFDGSNQIKDLKKNCYYDDLAYSEGSRMVQEDVLLVCKRAENGYLIWTNK
jgi:hypothetical protein